MQKVEWWGSSALRCMSGPCLLLGIQAPGQSTKLMVRKAPPAQRRRAGGRRCAALARGGPRTRCRGRPAAAAWCAAPPVAKVGSTAAFSRNMAHSPSFVVHCCQRLWSMLAVEMSAQPRSNDTAMVGGKSELATLMMPKEPTPAPARRRARPLERQLVGVAHAARQQALHQRDGHRAPLAKRGAAQLRHALPRAILLGPARASCKSPLVITPSTVKVSLPEQTESLYRKQITLGISNPCNMPSREVYDNSESCPANHCKPVPSLQGDWKSRATPSLVHSWLVLLLLRESCAGPGSRNPFASCARSARHIATRGR